MSDDVDDVINLKTAAALLHLSQNSMRKAALAGEIPGVRIGASWRFSRTEIRRLLRTPASSEPHPGKQRLRAGRQS